MKKLLILISLLVGIVQNVHSQEKEKTPANFLCLYHPGIYTWAGFSMGMVKPRLGFQITGRWDMSPVLADYNMEGGIIDDDYYDFTYTGTSGSMRWEAMFGFNYGFFTRSRGFGFVPYVSGGYGQYTYVYKYDQEWSSGSDEAWVADLDTRVKGFAFEGGALLVMGRFVLGAGVSMISFERPELTIGIGGAF